MTHDDLPDEGTGGEALTFDEGVDALADVFTDQDLDPSDDDQPAPQEADEEDDSEDEADDVEVEEDDDEDVEAEEADDESEDVDQDDSEEDESGSEIATDDLTVTLDDGTRITVAELKRNNLFQRDYTQKTTEHAQRVKEFDAKVQEFSELEQSLAEMRETLLGFYQAKVPQEPTEELLATDPVKYYADLAAYNKHVKEWNSVYEQRQQEAEKQRQKQTQEQQLKSAQELNSLLAKLPPKFQNEKELQSFLMQEVAGATEHYGFSREEISQALGMDHRMVLALRDANAYRRLKKKAPDVQKKVAQKPKLVKGGKRPDPKAQKSKRKSAQSAALRKSGDFDLGVKEIESLL